MFEHLLLAVCTSFSTHARSVLRLTSFFCPSFSLCPPAGGRGIAVRGNCDALFFFPCARQQRGCGGAEISRRRHAVCLGWAGRPCPLPRFISTSVRPPSPPIISHSISSRLSANISFPVSSQFSSCLPTSSTLLVVSV